jgi:hypothetical protein
VVEALAFGGGLSTFGSGREIDMPGLPERLNQQHAARFRVPARQDVG